MAKDDKPLLTFSTPEPALPDLGWRCVHCGFTGNSNALDNHICPKAPRRQTIGKLAREVPPEDAKQLLIGIIEKLGIGDVEIEVN